MQPTITITMDEKGNATVGDLPQGVFYSRFAAPPDAQIRDVISINAAGIYRIEVEGPGVTDPWSTAPVETPLKSRTTFFVDTSILPVLQLYGTAGCQTGGGEYILGVIVNPSVVLVPITVTQQSIMVNQSTMPKGVHFKNTDVFSVWAAGGYTFAFSLMPEQGLLFDGVVFTKPAPMVTSEISEDRLTAWIYNNNLATSPGCVVDFNLLCSTPGTTSQVIIDPTIINNPINQGGGGIIPYQPEPRYELVGALAE